MEIELEMVSGGYKNGPQFVIQNGGLTEIVLEFAKSRAGNRVYFTNMFKNEPPLIKKKGFAINLCSSYTKLILL